MERDVCFICQNQDKGCEQISESSRIMDEKFGVYVRSSIVRHPISECPTYRQYMKQPILPPVKDFVLEEVGE